MKTSIVFLMAVCWLATGEVGADDVFKWVDNKGNVHFTDSPDSIPEKYRKKTQHRKMRAPVRQESGDTAELPSQQVRKSANKTPTRSSPFQMKKRLGAKKSNNDSQKERRAKEKKRAKEAAQKRYMDCMFNARDMFEASFCVPKGITKPSKLEIQP